MCAVNVCVCVCVYCRVETRLPRCFQGKELLSQRIPLWQQACAEPNKLPDRALFLAQQMSGVAGAMVAGAHHPGMTSEPLSGAKPLPVPPELAALRASGGLGQQVGPSAASKGTHTHTQCPLSPAMRSWVV